ncbi:MAG: ABC transporter ATP-binding protein [Desulfomonile tiedjei]|uniref:ABC transporter ATP-binding protein n=1 Tax=Desulfomonile tiedjei TaxID=2358 RepID=A0A9D6Z2A8_9BACT|nr:ABC transporter ATP-binding protein [Desulfomonile tiedjei]
MANLPLENNDDFAIRTEKLCRDFGKVEAVKNLHLQVKRGELFGLVGPDGAGKTTTMRMLAGILDPTSGSAWVDGISIVDDPEGIKEHLAYMPQRFGLYQDLTVMENLIFYADLFRVPKKLRAGRIETLFGFSRLGPFKDRLAGALSGGMKQKLGLACALIHSPRVLLLDEPTNGVDPVSRRDFWKILYELLKEGISILVSTAYLDEAERTNRVGLMHQGRLVQLGEPRALKSMLKGITMELIPSDPAKTRTLLRNMPGLLDVNIFGGGLHVRIPDKSTGEAILKRLEAEAIEVRSFRRIVPSMEDAFLYLIPRGQEEDKSGVSAE